MNNLQKHIDLFIQAFRNETLYVACSGGIDSMVLLHLLSNSHPKIHVLHVNYHLRGEESNLDQLLIESVCRQNEIPLSISSIDLKIELQKNKHNLQEKARELRYAFFKEFLDKSSSKIVIAHHQDDQIETFFINLARKSGVMGMSAMLTIHDNILRPLLTIPRSEIIQYATDNNIQWREDKSNLENTYQRNKWRNIFLPFIEKEVDTIKESVLLLIEKFQETQLDLEKRVIGLAIQIRELGVLTFNEYDLLNEAERFELLRQVNLASTGIHLELNKLRSTEKGKKIALKQSDFCEILREDTYFFFQKKVKTALPKLVQQSVSVLPEKLDKQSIYLNKAQIKGELVLRYWEIGDRIKPIGLKGSKLISAVITDAKVPNHLRSQQLVLCDDSTILWCVGLCIGNTAIAKIGDNIIKLNIHKFH